MSDQEKDKVFVKKYYDQEAPNYIRKYTQQYEGYPTYTLRLKLASDCIRKKKIRKIVDCGCGSCGPLISFTQKGYEIKGFDISREMVKFGKKQLEKAGLKPDLVVEADLESGPPFEGEKFDVALAFGLFPHVKDEVQSMRSIGKMLNKEGFIYASFRNDLFALFSLNEYSYNFFLNKLFGPMVLGDELAEEGQKFFSNKFSYNEELLKRGNQLRYQDIYATFHNPFTVEKDLFSPAGFKVERILFHHFHILPPALEQVNPAVYRQLSLSMEKPEDWKGYFMASTFLVEAKKVDG